MCGESNITMGAMQRRKGANGEREIVIILKNAGIDTKRISMMETNHTDKGDIVVDVDSESLVGSVKLGSHVPKFLYDALGGADMLFSRRDRQKWMVTIPLDILLRLIHP